ARGENARWSAGSIARCTWRRSGLAADNARPTPATSRRIAGARRQAARWITGVGRFPRFRQEEITLRSTNKHNAKERNRMSLKIRMARAGTKKRPVYHIVVADSRYPRDGRFIERLGYFNPLLPKDNKERLKFDLEKAKAWLAKGAQPSDRIMRFLDA